MTSLELFKQAGLGEFLTNGAAGVEDFWNKNVAPHSDYVAPTLTGAAIGGLGMAVPSMMNNVEGESSKDKTKRVFRNSLLGAGLGGLGGAAYQGAFGKEQNPPGISNLSKESPNPKAPAAPPVPENSLTAAKSDADLKAKALAQLQAESKEKINQKYTDDRNSQYLKDSKTDPNLKIEPWHTREPVKALTSEALGGLTYAGMLGGTAHGATRGAINGYTAAKEHFADIYKRVDDHTSGNSKVPMPDRNTYRNEYAVHSSGLTEEPKRPDDWSKIYSGQPTRDGGSVMIPHQGKVPTLAQFRETHMGDIDLHNRNIRDTLNNPDAKPSDRAYANQQLEQLYKDHVEEIETGKKHWNDKLTKDYEDKKTKWEAALKGGDKEFDRVHLAQEAMSFEKALGGPSKLNTQVALEEISRRYPNLSHAQLMDVAGQIKDYRGNSVGLNIGRSTAGDTHSAAPAPPPNPSRRGNLFTGLFGPTQQHAPSSQPSEDYDKVRQAADKQIRTRINDRNHNGSTLPYHGTYESNKAIRENLMKQKGAWGGGASGGVKGLLKGYIPTKAIELIGDWLLRRGRTQEQVRMDNLPHPER